MVLIPIYLAYELLELNLLEINAIFEKYDVGLSEYGKQDMEDWMRDGKPQRTEVATF